MPKLHHSDVRFGSRLARYITRFCRAVSRNHSALSLSVCFCVLKSTYTITRVPRTNVPAAAEIKAPMNSFFNGHAQRRARCLLSASGRDGRERPRGSSAQRTVGQQCFSSGVHSTAAVWCTVDPSRRTCCVCFAQPPAVTMKMEFTPAANRNRDTRRAAHLVDLFILASRLEVG
jgi:hypothetical protein